MKTWIQLATKDSVSFGLTSPLISGKPYVLCANTVYPLLVSIDGVYVGKLENGILHFNATNSMTNVLTLTSVDKVTNLDLKIKLEQGLFGTEYSPAPEDAYDLDLPNGAYHIQGGNSFSKIVESGVHVGVNTYAWSNITLNGKPLPLGTVVRYRENGDGLSFVGTNLDFIASTPGIFGYLADPYLEVTTEIVNEGNIYSKPMIRISYEGSQQKELRMTIGNTQMIYNWPTNEKEVEYDTSTGYSYHKGQRRDRHWHIDMAPFELPIGETKVVKETRYDTKVEVMEESRWR